MGRTSMSKKELERVEVLARIQSDELRLVDGSRLMARRQVESLDEEAIVADVRSRHLSVAARAGVGGLGPEWPLL